LFRPKSKIDFGRRIFGILTATSPNVAAICVIEEVGLGGLFNMVEVFRGGFDVNVVDDHIGRDDESRLEGVLVSVDVGRFLCVSSLFESGTTRRKTSFSDDPPSLFDDPLVLLFFIPNRN
jgi:hypothetical protein